ncbi:hypothetical protein MVEN_00317900 [Mycena venus]|uniref:Uncharacterized protein n=1 Tax=Mycena venus TaxID=2733690 RepID=A0A8H7D7Q6_9AGAR|nr:hypothetical protein MVEN_00317900 [Mycena venus]
MLPLLTSFVHQACLSRHLILSLDSINQLNPILCRLLRSPLLRGVSFVFAAVLPTPRAIFFLVRLPCPSVASLRSSRTRSHVRLSHMSHPGHCAASSVGQPSLGAASHPRSIVCTQLHHSSLSFPGCDRSLDEKRECLDLGMSMVRTSTQWHIDQIFPVRCSEGCTICTRWPTMDLCQLCRLFAALDRISTAGVGACSTAASSPPHVDFTSLPTNAIALSLLSRPCHRNSSPTISYSLFVNSLLIVPFHHCLALSLRQCSSRITVCILSLGFSQLSKSHLSIRPPLPL